MIDPGIKVSVGQPIRLPLPTSWLGKTAMPPAPPAWAGIGALSSTQIRNLLAQIGYDLSEWNYELVQNNRVGRYQFSGQQLEAYGLLATGSYATYGNDCINYTHAWKPVVVSSVDYPYENYFYNITSLSGFLNSRTSQEHLAYQRLVDVYVTGKNIGLILDTDSIDVVAGMMYVGWTLGVGTAPTAGNVTGTGAWAWRYFNVGNGVNSFNSGRYAITVLSA